MTEPMQPEYDIERAYQSRRRSREAEEAWAKIDSWIAAEGSTAAPEEASKSAKPQQGAGVNIPGPQASALRQYDIGQDRKASRESARRAGGVATEVALGAAEMPLQIVGGIGDAANNTLNAFHDMANWLDENVADLGKVTYSPETGVNFTSAKRAKRMAQKLGMESFPAPQLPVPDEADTVAGGAVRSISQFLAGFWGAGKLTGLKAATRGGEIGIAALHGAMADATVFDPHEERLSNLIEQVPALHNPITAYLAADPEDSAAEGRFKNAVEGLIPGVAVDGLIAGLRVIRAGRAARRAAGASQAVEQGAESPLRVVKRGELEALLSDRPVRRTLALESADEMKPQDVLTEGGGRPGPPEGPTPLREGEPIEIDAPHVEIDAGEVFINWARINTDDDVKALMRDLADAKKPEIDKARRGVQTWEQTKLNAKQEDAWKILTERRTGEPLGAEQSLAVRQLWVSSAEKVKSLAELAATNPSDANLFAFRKMVAVHNTIQKQVIAARTETARALQSWRIPAGSDAELAREIGDLVEYMGGEKVSRVMAEKVVQLTRSGSEKELDAFIATSTMARTRAAISQAWYFSLLSGPHTHMRNMISNTFVVGQQLYERKAANLIGQMMGQENVVRGETMAELYGVIEGAKEALRISSKGRRILREAGEVALQGPEGREAARQMLEHGKGEFGTVYRSMATGEAGIGIGKLETSPAGAFSSETWALDPESGMGRAMDMIDSVTGSAGRALMAEDELFKTIGYRAELHALAHRQVAQEVASGALEATPEAMKRRAVEIIADPEETMRFAAMDAAAYRTFTQKPGEWVSGISQAFNSAKHPVIRAFGTILWPFRRTPANIFKYGLERTPLAPFMTQYKEAIEAGGARADIARARMATGSLLLLTAVDLAMSGHITGEGPPDPQERATLRRQGWQPNSIKVGDRYFSFRGMEPMSQTLGIAANLVEILQNTGYDEADADMEQVIIAATMAIAAQSTSANYMTGVSDAVAALNDPQRYGENWWNRLAGSVVPTGVAQVARMGDPNMRAVEDMIDKIKSRTPGLSKTLPFSRDAWGRPISYRSGLGTIYDVMSPSYSSKMDSSPIDKELNRLEHWVGKPKKKASFTADMAMGYGTGSVTVDLGRFPHAYDRYLELQGNALTHTADGVPIDPAGQQGLFDTLNAIVSGKHALSSLYDMASEGADGEKAAIIQEYRHKYMRAARKQLLLEFPDLREEVIRRMPQESPIQ